MRDVDPKAVDAAVEPEAEDLVEAVLHGLVMPVEIGLLGREEVEVVVARLLVERPGRAAECGRPGVRRAAVPAGPEHVALPVGVRGVGDRVPKPLVLVGRVVGNNVDRHLDPALVRVGDELVEVGERAEERIDVDIVCDVVAVVGLRRGVEGRQPERVDAELLQVGQPGADALQVADTVPVRVLEAADIDLVEGGAPPPRHTTADDLVPGAHGHSVTRSTWSCDGQLRRMLLVPISLPHAA